MGLIFLLLDAFWCTAACAITNLFLSFFCLSRHTVVCRAAQEAGAQPREYIDRKKENAIFAPP